MNKTHEPNNLLKALFVFDIVAVGAYLVLLIGFPDLGLHDSVYYGYKTPFVNNQPYLVLICVAAVSWLNFIAFVYCAAHDISNLLANRLKPVFGLKWWVYVIGLILHGLGVGVVNTYARWLKTYDRLWMDLAPALFYTLLFMAIFIIGCIRLKKARQKEENN